MQPNIPFNIQITWKKSYECNTLPVTLCVNGRGHFDTLPLHWIYPSILKTGTRIGSVPNEHNFVMGVRRELLYGYRNWYGMRTLCERMRWHGTRWEVKKKKRYPNYKLNRNVGKLQHIFKNFRFPGIATKQYWKYRLRMNIDNGNNLKTIQNQQCNESQYEQNMKICS